MKNLRYGGIVYERMDDLFDSCWRGVQFGGTYQDPCLVGYAEKEEKNRVRKAFFLIVAPIILKQYYF